MKITFSLSVKHYFSGMFNANKLLFGLLLVTWFFKPAGVYSQEINFNHITTEHGLSQNSILAITQDSRGFMWFGTRFGLNRYDGIRVRVFKSNKTDEKSLTDDYITALFSDSKGRIWVGTANGVNKFNPVLNQFDRIYLNENGKYQANRIFAITEDKDGRVCMATKHGLYISENNNDNTFIKATSKGLPTAFGDTEFQSIFEDSDGYFWAGTNKGLLKMHFGSQVNLLKIYEAKDNAGISDLAAITAIAEDSKKNLWLGTETGGLNMFDKSLQTFTAFVHNETDPNSLIHNAIRTILCNHNGQLWIGTQEGLSILDPTNRTFKTIQHKKDDENGLSQNSIYSIFEDNNRSIWIGTYYGGVNVNYAYSTGFNKMGHGDRLLSNNVVSSIVEDGNRLWIGTEGGGLNYIDRDLQKYGAFVSGNKQGSLSSDLIKVVYKDRFNNIWAGTHGGGLNLLNKNKQTFRRYETSFGKVNPARSEIIAIIEDEKGLLWVGGHNGLDVFKNDDGDLRPVEFTGLLKKFKKQYITGLFRDSKGNIWIATNTNLFKFNPVKNSLVNIIVPLAGNSVNNSLNNVNCLKEDANGNIWIGLYHSGLGLLDASESKLSRIYTVKDGLPEMNVTSVLEDDRNQMWIGTSDGLAKFDPETGYFQNYTRSDGLAGNDFNYNSAFKAQNGELFFGGYNGLTYFFPENIQRNPKKEPVVFTGLVLANVPEDSKTTANGLANDISFLKKLNLKHDQNIFTIEFSLLNYVKSAKNLYAYKLEGINDIWIESHVPSANYINLPAGTYKFLVKGRNNDGVWSDPISIEIEIDPPAWKSWWAYTLYTILLGVIIFFVTRFFYLRQLIAKDEELHRLKLDFFTNVSHEIRTHLSLIMTPIDKMIDNDEKHPFMHKSLLQVKKNADRLLRLVTELMDFRKAETRNLRLHVTENKLSDFLESIIASLEEMALRKNISLKLETKTVDILVYFDSEQMEKVFFNLISNALKFTPIGGAVRVKAWKADNKAYITVEDTGHGIDEKYMDKLFNNYFQVDDYNHQNTGYGIGLALSKTILELHRGQIEVKSATAGAGSQGFTCFTVSLLLGSTHFDKNAIEINKPELTVNPTKNVLLLKPDYTEGPSKTSRILIVEDNGDIRAMIRESMEETYIVIEANNGLNGWKIASEEIPDLVISDVMMPGMDGYTFCNTLKSDLRTSHIPIIMLTAKNTELDEIEGFTKGADAYITKPFSDKILLLQVQNLLKAREAIRRKFGKSISLDPKELVVDDPDQKFIEKLIDIIDKNMDDESFGVDMLSAEIGMSQSVLYKKLKAITGMSVNDFSKYIRLKKAGQLLKQKRYTVYEISYMIGFSDRKYFSKEFKKQFGKTPTEYVEAE